MADPLRTLSEFVSSGATRAPHWHHKARILLADAIVLARASGRIPELHTVHELGAGAGGHRSWATDAMLGAADAVHANAVAVHARFQDDTDMTTWAHPAGFVVPSAVTATALAGGRFEDLLDALVAGYAATSWLGADGAVAARLKARGFRPNPTFAPLGACASAARALRLDPERTGHALGAAALLGRGTLHSVGAGGGDWRLHHPGGARDGFVSALAARHGMRSAPAALTAPNGFLAAFTGSPEAPAEWATPPSGELITGVWHKAFPTLGDNTAVALAAHALAPRVSGRVDAMRIRMNSAFAVFPGTQGRPPFRTPTAAQASVAFASAHLLLTGRLDWEDLHGPYPPEVIDLAERIVVRADDELSYTDAVVEVDTEHGTVTCRTSDRPPTLLHRDREEQARVAEGLLGHPGADAVAAILDADRGADAREVVDHALDLLPS